MKCRIILPHSSCTGRTAEFLLGYSTMKKAKQNKKLSTTNLTQPKILNKNNLGIQ
jgi:hypothetical protein